MTFKVPETRDEIFNSVANKVKTNLPKSNPWKRLSWIKALLIGISCLFYDLYQTLLIAVDDWFDDTCSLTTLVRKAAPYGVTINPALQSSGFVSFPGTVGTNLPITASLVNSDGATFTPKATADVANYLQTLTSITYASGVATAVYPAAHNLGTGMEITIAGASPTELNGAKIVTVIDELTVTFDTVTPGSGSASGTITSSIDMVSIEVESDETGEDKNMLCGDNLVLSSGIPGINNTGFVQVDGISGGVDQESPEDFRARYIYRKQHPVTLFNVYAIEVAAMAITFVKRVFVRRITPAVGQVTIYFLKALNAIPTAGEIATVKAVIDALSPATTDTADIFVNAPTPLPVDYVITGLYPDTPSMQLSIINRLTAYYLIESDVGVTIPVNEHTSLVQTTVDTENGDTVQSFTLTTPSTATAPASDEIPTLGSVTFA
jgi:uncharacterized phage protein gp47/JayE